MPMVSVSLILLLFIILVHTSTIILSTSQVAILYVPTNNLSNSCDPSCNSTCQFCEDSQCRITDDSCYIANQCYMANQTASDSSSSCLQCQPTNNQTQWSFNPECSAGPLCMNPSFLLQNTCPPNIIQEFYINPEDAVLDLYNSTACGRDQLPCQAGFFLASGTQRFACCSGYFCPTGQPCMIPCRLGAYCPSQSNAIDGICQTPVKCPVRQPIEFGHYGCGGSTIEGFCPDGTFCPNTGVGSPCPNSTSYCPTGVVKPLPCLTHFECINGRAHRGQLFKVVLLTIFFFLVFSIAGVKFFEFATLKKKWFGNDTTLRPSEISDYFKKRNASNDSKSRFQLSIHLYRAKLRDVTRFDPELNEGFTGRIVAGRITALMGGSGCGKSSLLDTIHGRRRLRSGSITFADHEPLSTLLTDFIGYVPQADIMHEDLTVFETVYYSARTRRLGDSKSVIRNDVSFVLDKLGLKNMHNNMTKTLSGGQRKRVNVAMEVASCPKVILLDEPTSGLDTASCDDLFTLLELIKDSEAGAVTIIMVIHQPSYELFQRIDDIFFLTPLCCLAYQGPRDQALQHLKRTLFQENPEDCPEPRQNESDTCFIMLTKADKHINNHRQKVEINDQVLSTYSWQKRFWLPFFYVMSRSVKQSYMRCVIGEVAYLLAYFLLGGCVGYLFQNEQQDTCTIITLPTIYFLISLAFGILTCISSQRLFGVETINGTYERESRNYFHPFQYWLAKSLVDVFRLIFYPLFFLSILYIEIVPRDSFSSYFGVMILLSFTCTSIGQFASVVFNRTEYAYLGGTILALLSCLLSGFSPLKSELGHLQFVTAFSFSRHVQNLLFRQETAMYVKDVGNATHLWSTSVEGLKTHYSFDNSEHPYLGLILLGIALRIITYILLYIKSEYRSEHRFRITHAGPILTSILCCEPCRRDPHRETHIQM